MTPASRPALPAYLSDEPDYVVPMLVADVPEADELYRAHDGGDLGGDRRRCARRGVSDEFAAYLLPNAVAIRFTESADLLNLHHKFAMRLCYNAQEEIWRASLDEALQIREVNPRIGPWLLPPCTLRHHAEVRPVCPEGDRFCGVVVWKQDAKEYVEDALTLLSRRCDSMLEPKHAASPPRRIRTPGRADARLRRRSSPPRRAARDRSPRLAAAARCPRAGPCGSSTRSCGAPWAGPEARPTASASATRSTERRPTATPARDSRWVTLADVAALGTKSFRYEIVSERELAARSRSSSRGRGKPPRTTGRRLPRRRAGVAAGIGRRPRCVGGARRRPRGSEPERRRLRSRFRQPRARAARLILP